MLTTETTEATDGIEPVEGSTTSKALTSARRKPDLENIWWELQQLEHSLSAQVAMGMSSGMSMDMALVPAVIGPLR